MALTLAGIKSRVKTESKDAQNQYDSQRESWITDILREISTAKSWRCFQTITTVTVPAVDVYTSLPSDLYQIKGVTISGERIEALSELDYIGQESLLTEFGQAGYYRIKFESNLWKITFVNVDAGTTAKILYQKINTDVTTYPDWFENCLVLGATARSLQFMEHADMSMMDRYYQQYRAEIDRLFLYVDANVQDDIDMRLKTQGEIDSLRADAYFKDAG